MCSKTYAQRMPNKKKKSNKRPAGRPAKNYVEPIPDTPENVAKALFGIKSNRKKKHTTQS